MSLLSRIRQLASLAVVTLESAALLCLAQTNVLTYRNDNQRTAQNLSETILTPANVQSATFGLLFNYPTDGLVDAQPLVVSGMTIGNMQGRNVVFTATENDSVYSFDAVTGATYWKVSVLGPGETPSDNRGCGQVTPTIGITSTPVIDLLSGPHGTIYVIGMTRDSSGNYHHRLHALDITTGAEQFGGPVEIGATYSGSGDNSSNGNVVFDPKQYKERTALLLVDGVIYTSWASHCDARPYTGWTMGYNETTLAQTSVFNFSPNGNEAAVWGAGGGVSADSKGNLYYDIANGTFDTTLNSSGFPGKGDYGNAFVKIALVGGVLTSLDYWTMDNTTSESNADVDLGSGGVLLIPDLMDSTGAIRHFGTGAGKDANVYLFDRDNMGKFDSANNGTLYQELPGALAGGAWSSPAWFNGNLYYGGENDVIRSFQMNPETLMLGATPTSTSPTSYPYPGASPSISADGTANAILWAVENSSPAVLRAYDANRLGTELYNSNQAALSRDHFGNGNKYITPVVANGRVFAGTPDGVAVFGLLPAPDATLSPSSVGFPSQTVRTTSSAVAITLTNSGSSPLTISGIAVAGTDPGDFGQTNNCPVSPATIAVNGFCTINVTFTPLAANARSAAITITDNGAGSPQSVALSGTGTANTGPPAWPNGYGYQATFTVAAGQVPSAQTNFPALISGTYADFATTANGGRISNTCTQTVGSNATSVPCDLIFTSDAAGTVLLNWEFETYAATTGAVNIWVNAPNLNTGTVIHAWYGQPSVTTLQTTPSATWGSNFMAVYHLKENPAGAAPQLNDSTANGNNATMNGTQLASQQQPGEIDGSVNFEGDTWAGIANPANFSFERTDSFSLSGWFKIASNSAGTLLSKFTGADQGWALLQFTGATPAFSLGLFGTNASTSVLAETPDVTIGSWHYVVATYSGTSTVAGVKIYVDGVNQTLTTLSNNLTTSIVNTVTPVINGRSGPEFDVHRLHGRTPDLDQRRGVFACFRDCDFQ